MPVHVKQSYSVVTFATTTQALAMERRAGQLQIPGRIIPTPAAITATCGLCWGVVGGDEEEVRTLLEANAISYEGIHQVML